MKRITFYFSDSSAPVTIQNGEITAAREGVYICDGDGAKFIFNADKVKYFVIVPNESD